MPRLALVGPSWPLRGGIAATTTALAAALEARGSLAAFLTPGRQYPRWLYPGGGDIDPGACPRLEAADRCFGVVEPWTWPRVRRRLRGVAADAVVLPYWTWAWAPFELLAAAAAGPVVGVVHNPADHDAGALARWAAGAVLRRCRGFLCHASSVAATLEERYPGVPTAVHVLPSGPARRGDRAAARRELGVPDGAVAVLCFGLMRPYKGVGTLLEAVERLEPGLPLVLLLAGEPWRGAGEELRRALGRPGLAGRVIRRLEWIGEAEAGAWFDAADAAVLPYRSATGSAVAARALAWGLPVVASRVGGLAEVVEDGENGLLVPPGDPPALAAALRRIATESGLRATLAAGARRRAARSSWDGYAAALEALVVRVVA